MCCAAFLLKILQGNTSQVLPRLPTDCKVTGAQSNTLGNMLILLTIMMTRKVILHLDNADQGIFIAIVINTTLFPELKIQTKN